MRPVPSRSVAVLLVALLLVLSLLLSAWYCAFPWSMTRNAGAQTTARTDPMTLIYAVDDSTEARRQIEAGSARILEAWRTGDARLFASVYALDAALLQPGTAPVSGREAIRERMEEVFRRDRLARGSITVRDVFVLGDHAYATGTWRFEIGPIGKRARSRSGRFVDIWVREGGGRWMKWRDVGVPG